MVQNKQRLKDAGLKRLLLIIFDIVLVVVGISILVVGAVEWYKTGFDLKPKYMMGRNDGNEAVGIIIIGIGISTYGLIDYYFYRKKRTIRE